MEEPEIESRLRAFFEADPQGVAAVYLFGSMARGTSSAQSDVDVGILYPETPSLSFETLPLRLEGELERFLGRPVEVVVLNHAPVDLIHQVLRDGKLLLDRHPSARIRFEVRSRNEYFDLEPILRLYRKMEPPGRRELK